MTEVKQEHTYSETHEFRIEEGPVEVARVAPSSMLLRYSTVHLPSSTFTDEQLQKIVDLLNEYLLWKKYRSTTMVFEGSGLNVVRADGGPTGDATGEPV